MTTLAACWLPYLESRAAWLSWIQGAVRRAGLFPVTSTSVSGSRDGKLFVASAAAILQVDLEAGWAVTDVGGQFACSSQTDRTVTGNRDGSVWISGCAYFRDSSGEYLPQPDGIGGSVAPVASAYDLYDNHWALAPDQEGSTVVAVRAAGTPGVWQVVNPQPGGNCNLLAIDASGFTWVSGAESGVRRMDPHRLEEGWHTPKAPLIGPAG